jgi:hypothetical protein
MNTSIFRKNSWSRVLILALVAVLVLSCSTSKSKKSKTKPLVQSGFIIPSFPASLKTPEQRGDFLMEHYWDNYNFADTSNIHQPEFAEQPFADFASILLAIPVEKASEGIVVLMGKAQVNERMLRHFLELSEKYFYDPNSPDRSEPLYVAFLESFLASPNVDGVYKIRPQRHLDLARKNAEGHTATNFTYTEDSGSKGTLFQIRSALTLLYFNNPGCPECRHLREQILSSKRIQVLQQEGRLKILSVYPDEDKTAWKEHADEHPAGWINAYDKTARIKKTELYDLKAIPTLYLLDVAKKVLLKDPRFEDLEWYLSNKVS